MFIVVVRWFVVLVFFVDLSFVTNCFRYCVGFGWVVLVFACILLICVSGVCVLIWLRCLWWSGSCAICGFCGFRLRSCCLVWFGAALVVYLLIVLLPFIRYGMWFGSGGCLLFMFGWCLLPVGLFDLIVVGTGVLF